MKSNFIMNMSHDFRTPASGIYHMSQTIYKKITDDKLKKLQKLVVDSSGQLINFIDDILDYSRLDNDICNLKVEKINLNLLVDEVILFLAAKAHEKLLTLQADHDVQLEYYTDRFMLHRILLNLVSNAIKFTFSGSVLVAISIDFKNECILIKVQDTGIGIIKHFQSKIFEPFYRIENSEIPTAQGLGLGLTNVNLMLKKIGATIFVESEVGKGSIFTVCLPLSLPPVTCQ